MKVSLSPLTFQIFDVLSFKTLLMRVRTGTIWSFQDHSSDVVVVVLFLAAAVLVCVGLPPRPFRDLAGAGTGASSSREATATTRTLSAERADQLSKKAYISIGILCCSAAPIRCWSSWWWWWWWSTSYTAASTSAAKPDAITSSSLLIRMPGTARADLRKLRRTSNVSGEVTASEDSAMALTASVVLWRSRRESIFSLVREEGVRMAD